MKNILVLSHCILNSASKVAHDEGALSKEYETREKLLKLIINNNIQIIQLPCPEFQLYGSRRWGHVKDQFDHPHFREECRKMLYPILFQLEEYLSYPEEYKVLGVVSVEGSPSCGYHLTCRADWKGEMKKTYEEYVLVRENIRMAKEPGVYMEILEKELEAHKLNIPIISMDEALNLLSK